MRSLLSLFLVFATPLGATFARDACAGCAPDKLCAVHAATERQRLPELRGRMRKSDDAGRIEALREAAALTQEHDNAPSAAVVSFLGEAFEYESIEVRKAALELLGPGQHVAASRTQLARILERNVRVLEKGFDPVKPLKLEPLDPDKDVLEQVRDISKKAKIQTDAMVAELDEHIAAYALMDGAAKRLAAIGDLRDESLLTKDLARLRGHSRIRPSTLLDHLLVFRTRSAFQTVVEAFGDYAGDGSEVEVTGFDGKPTQQLDWGGEVHRALLAAVEAHGWSKPEFQPRAPVRPVWREWLLSGEVAFRER